MKATGIHMRLGCNNSDNVLEIDSIYIEGCSNPGWFKKEDIHDYLKKNPNTIYVNRSPFPYLIPATSAYGEKYVRSEPNDTVNDNLLKLPRY